MIMSEANSTIRAIIKDQPVAVAPKTSAAEAAGLLLENKVRHVILIDAERHVVGVVSDREVLKHFVRSMDDQAPVEQANAENESAPWELSSLTTREPVTVSANVSLADAGLLMIKRDIACLPVVDEHRRLIGSVTLPDVLQQFADQAGPALEEEFKLFKPSTEAKPRIPAFFRRSNGALVMPVACLEDPALIPPFATLGYDSGSGRILVKLGSENEGGARKVIRDNDSFVIPASDFVAQFDIKFHGSAFDISKHKRSGCFVLLPKQPAPCGPTAAAAATKR